MDDNSKTFTYSSFLFFHLLWQHIPIACILQHKTVFSVFVIQIMQKESCVLVIAWGYTSYHCAFVSTWQYRPEANECHTWSQSQRVIECVVTLHRIVVNNTEAGLNSRGDWIKKQQHPLKTIITGNKDDTFRGYSLMYKTDFSFDRLVPTRQAFSNQNPTWNQSSFCFGLNKQTAVRFLRLFFCTPPWFQVLSLVTLYNAPKLEKTSF